MVEKANLEVARSHYQEGKAAFERGRYRESVAYLEKAVNLLDRNSLLGGEAQIWLITAYEATEQTLEAIALCEQVSQHPDPEMRKQGKRLLYILKAPRLKTRPEWLSQIPDLSNLEDDERNLKGAASAVKAPPRPRPQLKDEPVDLSQVNTKDNQFIWVAFGAIALILGYLVWAS
jgi:tetratricopeptide (TPR) repeat protein